MKNSLVVKVFEGYADTNSRILTGFLGASKISFGGIKIISSLSRFVLFYQIDTINILASNLQHASDQCAVETRVPSALNTVTSIL